MRTCNRQQCPRALWLVLSVVLAGHRVSAQDETAFARKLVLSQNSTSSYTQLQANLRVYQQQNSQVQQLMKTAPLCAELRDLHSTLLQVEATVQAQMANASQAAAAIVLQSLPYTVSNSPPPYDLSATSPDMVGQQIVAIQQRAAFSGTGPAAWAVGANCTYKASSTAALQNVTVVRVNSAGKYIVQPANANPTSRQPATTTVTPASLTLVSPIAGAFWTPLLPTYDPSLPSYPVNYTDAEKQAQRDAGVAHAAALDAAINAGNTSYSFPPGVYRISDYLHVDRTTNFVLNMADVELITEGGGHFKLYSNTNLTIRGPLALEGDPFLVPQTVILSTDNATTLVVQAMPGYPPPTNQGRVLIFDSRGVRLPIWQAWPQSVSDLGGGNYSVVFSDYDMQNSGIAAAAQPGNYITYEGGPGGTWLIANNGVAFQQVNAYAGGAVFGQYETGLVSFSQWRSMRRPGTSRLFAGGNWVQIIYQGGSFNMDRSEVAYNWDDISDLFNWMGWTAFNGNSTNTIWAALEASWQPGQELSIYNGNSLQPESTAKVVSIINAQNQTALDALNAAFEAAGLRDTTIDTLYLVTLDKHVRISSLSMLDCLQARPQSISITNSYFHDGLNAGINARGGRNITITNNWVERTAVSGIAAGEDYWWWEGGMPGNVTIRDNTVRDTCNQPGITGCASITTYASAFNANATGKPIQSVWSMGNQVIHPAANFSYSLTQTKAVYSYGNLPVS